MKKLGVCLGVVVIVALTVIILRISSNVIVSTDAANDGKSSISGKIVNTLFIQSITPNAGLQPVSAGNQKMEFSVPSNSLFFPLSQVEDRIAQREVGLCKETPWVTKSLLIKPNLKMLEVGKPLVIDIFGQQRFTVVFKSKQKASGVSTNTVWRGQIEGEKLADITLVTTANGVMSGDIRIYGKALYEIRHVTDGIHAIRQIDETKMPPFATPIIPNQQDKKK